MRLQVLTVSVPDGVQTWLLVLDDIGDTSADAVQKVSDRLTAKAKEFGGAGALVFGMKVEVLG